MSFFKETAEEYVSKMKNDYLQKCCEEHQIAFETLPTNIVVLFKDIFIDYSIFILRQRMLAIQHCTPYGVFVLELSVSDGLEEAGISYGERKMREFFDYLVSTDEDFLRMCFLFAKCTEIAATKRQKQLLEQIAKLRQNRQDLVGKNEI